ncbi:MAG TPA: glycosyl hydrolase family 28-related protein [Mycobacteriales bacterium]
MQLSGVRRRFGFGLAAAVVASFLTTGALAAPASAAPTPTAPQSAAAAGDPDLGPNVLVFDPSMPQAEIQAAVDAVHARQVSDQFGTGRFSLFFKPGTYGSAAAPLRFSVGYYTEVAGLGRNPGDTVINGSIDVENQCFPTPEGAPTDCTALVNFWRSMSNLSITVTGQSGCQTGAEFWAVSQAAPMRRVQINGGNLSLMDYCSAGPQYASGGFIADSAVSGTTINGSQQQFLVRNSSLNGWSNGVWNQVFAGTAGAPPQSFPTPPYTTLDTTPVSKERPYLYVDAAGTWNVFVPSVARDSAGTTWAGGSTPGRSVPLSSFYLAKPGDSVAKINLQLLLGKNLLLTPGVYDVSGSIVVSHPNQVVLGLGLATLTAQRGATPLVTLDLPGIDVAGLMIDAGPQNSPVLFKVGTKLLGGLGSTSNPVAIQDVFFRIGGPHVGKATVSLEVNTRGTILDDIWAWRADHGEGVGWTVNTAETGVVVNGADVTATGLFVEHYQKYNVIWAGERGRTIFFQNEMPYDAPTQADWQHNGLNGYAAYKVVDPVRTHEAWGLGSYIYTNVNPDLHSTNAFEVPNRPGIAMHDLLTVSLNKAGTIDHVINGVGAAVTPERQGPETVVLYP